MGLLLVVFVYHCLLHSSISCGGCPRSWARRSASCRCSRSASFRSRARGSSPCRLSSRRSDTDMLRSCVLFELKTEGYRDTHSSKNAVISGVHPRVYSVSCGFLSLRGDHLTNPASATLLTIFSSSCAHQALRFTHPLIRLRGVSVWELIGLLLLRRCFLSIQSSVVPSMMVLRLPSWSACVFSLSPCSRSRGPCNDLAFDGAVGLERVGLLPVGV